MTRNLYITIDAFLIFLVIFVPTPSALLLQTISFPQESYPHHLTWKLFSGSSDMAKPAFLSLICCWREILRPCSLLTAGDAGSPSLPLLPLCSLWFTACFLKLSWPGSSLPTGAVLTVHHSSYLHFSSGRSSLALSLTPCLILQHFLSFSTEHKFSCGLVLYDVSTLDCLSALNKISLCLVTPGFDIDVWTSSFTCKNA